MEEESLPDRGERVLQVLNPDNYLKKYVKHFEDLIHAVPKHVLAQLPGWVEEHEVKSVDFSVDTVIADHYPFGKGEVPGGFSITVDAQRWRWLAIGTGNMYHKSNPVVREYRHVAGDSFEYFQSEATKIRVMRYARTCKPPEMEHPKDFQAVIVSGGYYHPTTIIASHLQFEPGVTDLVELIKGLDNPVMTLKEAMHTNPYNAVFVVEHFRELADNDIRKHVIEAVLALPLVAHRFPLGFLRMADVDEGKCGDLTHMLPVDQLCQTLDDVFHLFFHNPTKMRPPLPWRWIRNTFGPDGVDTLAAKILPEWLQWLPDSMHTPERVDRWIETMETSGRWGASSWLPDAFSLDDARQFRRIIAITKGIIPPGTKYLIPKDWWTEGEARLCTGHYMDAIPKHLLTHDVLADFLRSGRDYGRIPEHFRTSDLDKVAMFEVDTSTATYNYVAVKAPTIEMSRLYATRPYSCQVFIPAEHMTDIEVIKAVCSKADKFDAPHIYKAALEAQWSLVDIELVKSGAGLESVPEGRRTDELSRMASIDAYEFMTEPVRAERKEEHEEVEAKKRRERCMMWDDDDSDWGYSYDDWRPGSTVAQGAMAAELGTFN